MGNVYITQNTWNHLEHWVFEKWELSKGGGKKEMNVVFK